MSSIKPRVKVPKNVSVELDPQTGVCEKKGPCEVCGKIIAMDKMKSHVDTHKVWKRT